MGERSYITTPIYYVNDRPHIGHCYTTLVADCFARFERLRLGSPAWPDPQASVFFLTGTDEHADKVVTTAAERGLSPIQWADHNAQEFQKAFAFVQSSHDDFVRTTQPRHKDRVTEYVRTLLATGDIYKGAYEGWYDENQEEYLTETVAKDQNFTSATTGKPLVRRKEECYFFRLSKYEARLRELFAQHPEFVQPEARRNEVLGRLRDGLQDVAASRPVTTDPATQFGIRVPGDEGHRVYVWIDALFNYLSIVDTDERRAFWPAPPAHGSPAPNALVHFIAKDILWFHAVIWPAMLMALHDANPHRFAFVGLPHTVYSHAYWVREGRKMSKSLKNFIEVEQLRAYADKYSLDAVRWYLLTQGPLHATDADFSHAKFVEVYNADLANAIGNSASRVANMIEKYFSTLPAPVTSPQTGPTPAPGDEFTWSTLSRDALSKASTALARYDVAAALQSGTDLVRSVDQYINVTAPFKLAKTLDANPHAKAQLATILWNCAEALRIASVLLSPAMPAKMAQLWSAWGLTSGSAAPDAAAIPTLASLCTFAGPHALRPGQPIAKGDPLFMRADPAEAAPA
jgi:methionyl-tRNA synthetase